MGACCSKDQQQDQQDQQQQEAPAGSAGWTRRPERPSAVAPSEEAEAAQRNVTRAGEWADGLSTGLELVGVVLTVGAHLPLIGGVCEAAKGVLEQVQKYSEKLSDVVAAGQRTIDVLEFLEMMAKNVATIATEDKGRSVDRRLQELTELLDDVKQFLEAFGQKGWLERAWSLRSGAKTLTSLDASINANLTALRDIYDMARDAHVNRILNAIHEYPLEAAVGRAVARRREEQGEGEEAAAHALQADPEVLRSIAVEAGMRPDNSELRSEIAVVRERMEYIVQGLQTLREDNILLRKEMQKNVAEADAGPKYWLSIALQSPPGLLAPQNGRVARLVQCTNAIESKLNQPVLWTERTLPIRFSRTCKLSAELCSGEHHTIIWASLGSDYLSKEADNLECVKGALDQAREPEKLPRLLVVIMKHGARHAAEVLSTSGLPVIWLEGDVVCKNPIIGGRLIATAIVPELDNVLKDPSSAQAAADRMMQAGSKHGRVIIHGAGAFPTSTKVGREFQMPKELTEKNYFPKAFESPGRFEEKVELLSCDVGYIKQLVSKLEEEDGCRLYVRPADGVAKDGDNEHKRRRALALYVCEQLSESKYLQIHVLKVNCRSDSRKKDTIAALEALEKVLEPPSALLWLDVVGDPAEADVVLKQHLEDLEEKCLGLSVILTSKDGGTFPDFAQFVLGTSNSKVDTPISNLHDEVLITLSTEAHDIDDLLNSELAEKIKRALHRCFEEGLSLDTQGPSGDHIRPHLAAIYACDKSGTLALRMCIADVAFLHLLRDNILMRDFEKILSSELNKLPLGKLERLNTRKLVPSLKSSAGDKSAADRTTPTAAAAGDGVAEGAASKSNLLSVHVDLSAFAETYESSILRLDKLTPHQEAKLAEAHDQLNTGLSLHIKAPAGAGKTFVALHLILKLLTNCDDDHHVLFVATTPALCYFFSRWVAQRLEETGTLGALNRLHLLFSPFKEGPRAVDTVGDTIEAKPVRDNLPKYTLAVVDEAHHLYSVPELATQLENYTSNAVLLLLSDVSQSEGVEVKYPAQVARVVELTEVVRSSKRIISAASTFQLGKGTATATTTCQHAAQGPPLKTYLFDVDSKDAVNIDQLRRSTYAAKTLTAIRELRHKYKGLSLHNRLAILVPDGTFRAELEKELLASLKNDDDLAGLFELVNAEKASRVYQQGRASAATDDHQWILLDTVENVNGLERLMVMCVGLDTAIDGSNPDVLGTRSLIYRAISRAHMVAILVNELLPSGWLAHLAQVRLKDDAHFDIDAAMAATEAAQRLVEDQKAREAEVRPEIGRWMAARGSVTAEEQAQLIAIATKNMQDGATAAAAVAAAVKEATLKQVCRDAAALVTKHSIDLSSTVAKDAASKKALRELNGLTDDDFAHLGEAPGPAQLREMAQRLAKDAVRSAVDGWQALAPMVEHAVAALGLDAASTETWCAEALMQSQSSLKEEQATGMERRFLIKTVNDQSDEADAELGAMPKGVLKKFNTAQLEWQNAAEATPEATRRYASSTLTAAEAEAVTLAVAQRRMRSDNNRDVQSLADEEVEKAEALKVEKAKALKAEAPKREQAVWDASGNSTLRAGGPLKFDPIAEAEAAAAKAAATAAAEEEAKAAKAAAEEEASKQLHGAKATAAEEEEASKQLHQAAKTGAAAEVRRLLEAGAPVDEYKDNDGATALMRAAENGEKEVVPVLLEAGASVNAANKGGATALIAAAANGQKEVVPVLLEAGANVNATNDYGATALIWAARKGQKEVVAVLLEAGASIEAADKRGNTALICAAGNGRKEVVAVLLEAGADPTAKTNDGKTARDRAEHYGQAAVVELLDAHAAAKKAAAN